MYLKEVCISCQSVYEQSRTDIVLNIDDFLDDKLNAEKFFQENFITSGMQILFDKVFERLEGRGIIGGRAKKFALKFRVKLLFSGKLDSNIF